MADLTATHTEPIHLQRAPERTSVVGGAIWMVLISLALFFFPLVNGLIGGAVGGYLVGSARRALLAAILPAVVVAVGLWVLFALLQLPVVGILAGAAVAGIILFSDVGLFIGAFVGGLFASSPREQRRMRMLRSVPSV